MTIVSTVGYDTIPMIPFSSSASGQMLLDGKQMRELIFFVPDYSRQR